MRSDRVAVFLTLATAAFHLAFANRYDLFRDELYFIVCGQHPAFGYADQPPLVPLLAAAGYALGEQTWIVRLPAVFAAAALVWFVIAFVRLLGGRDGAAWMAGLCAALAPVLMGLTATLNTTTFEPLCWTVVAYGITRAAALGDRRALVWTGIVAGLAMEAKYSLPLWLVALAIGLALGPERRLFRYRELWIGLAIAFVIAVPSVVWQAVHGFPFVELVHNAGRKNLVVAPPAFAANQLLILNPLFAPVWLCGIVAPFARRDLRTVRFVPIAFLVTTLAIVAGHGKDYYLAPAYPALFAVGGVAIEELVRNAYVRAAYVGLAAALALVIAPLALPILSPERLVAYQAAIHLRAHPQERADAGDAIPPTLADMLGWHDFVREVGLAYDAIPSAERAQTSIEVDNYGEAASLDLYGRSYGLPPTLSGHNQYYFWGTRGQVPRNVLTVQYDPAALQKYCAHVKVLGTTQSRYARDFENGKAIAFCLGLHPSLEQLWPSLKTFI